MKLVSISWEIELDENHQTENQTDISNENESNN